MLIEIIFALVEQDQLQMKWLLNDLNKLVPFDDREDGMCELLSPRNV